MNKVFLLSPARIGGARSNMLFNPHAAFELAVRLREGKASIGELYAFISGLYFRGKLAYVSAFGSPPPGQPPALVIVPGLGLLPPQTRIDYDRFKLIGATDVSEDNPAFREPLLRDACEYDERTGGACQFILLGSVATAKYTGPLRTVFGDRLHFPPEFIGRGDMSRGGLMLRRGISGEEFTYEPIGPKVRRGTRPPKLQKP